jgi:hypothetical protein
VSLGSSTVTLSASPIERAFDLECSLISALLINDRSATAWLIVAAYFAGAAAAFWACGAARKRERRFWIGTALLLTFLGFNKELDLQTFVTDTARTLAHSEGWYDQRRLVQGLFLLLLAAGLIVAIIALARWLRRSSLPVKSAALGIALLFAFVVMRAGSFHHMDRWVTVNIGGLRRGWWLEFAGIAVIAASALAYRNLPRRKSR